MSLVKVMVSSFSIKRNINGKRPTEDKLIGVEDTMAEILWSKYFTEAHGL